MPKLSFDDSVMGSRYTCVEPDFRHHFETGFEGCTDCLDSLRLPIWALNLYVYLCTRFSFFFEITMKINILLCMKPSMRRHLFWKIHISTCLRGLTELFNSLFLSVMFCKLFGPRGLTVGFVSLFCGIHGSSMLHVMLTTEISFCSFIEHVLRVICVVRPLRL